MANKTESHSRLYYSGTNIEVQLGDIVKIKRWFWLTQSGMVIYLPGISHKLRDFEYDDIKQWAIKTDVGVVYPILYDPEHYQPPKHIIFSNRSDSIELDPNVKLDEWSDADDDS